MKKAIFTILVIASIFLLPKSVSALTYNYTNRESFHYDINNYYISGNDIVINGWGTTNNEQQLTGDDTHEFSMTLTSAKTGKSLTYKANLKYANKTDLLRMKTTNRVCGYWELNADKDYCYYNYAMAGFEFRIPISDLDVDDEYSILLRIWTKLVNKGYQIRIYTPAINKYYQIDGIRYWLNSDMNNTRFTNFGDPVFVRNGADVNASIQKGWQWCNYSNYTLYWKLYETYYNVKQVIQNRPGSIDSETWLNLKFNQGYCGGGRSRALNGTNYDGWVAAIYTDFSGIPATIKTMKVRSASIDNIKTYTAPTNDQTKVVVNLNSSVNQNNNIKAYHNNNLVYEKNITFNGNKEITINYPIPNSGNVKVVITEPNGLKTELEAPIYVSSEKEYIMLSNNTTISETTPVIVSKNKNGTINNYYERYNLTIPHNKITLTSGKGFDSWLNVNYYSDSNEIILNNDLSSKLFYPNQEDKLNYQMIDNKVVVNMNKISNSASSVFFDIDEYLLDKLNGTVFKKGNEPNNSNLISGERKWYTPISKPLGSYDYEYLIYDLGINKVKIKISCIYITNKTLIGNNNSEYIIKRVKTPSKLKYIHNKKYTYQELLKIGGK